MTEQEVVDIAPFYRALVEIIRNNPASRKEIHDMMRENYRRLMLEIVDQQLSTKARGMIAFNFLSVKDLEAASLGEGVHINLYYVGYPLLDEETRKHLDAINLKNEAMVRFEVTGHPMYCTTIIKKE